MYRIKVRNNIFNALRNKLKLSFFTNNAKHPELEKGE